MPLSLYDYQEDAVRNMKNGCILCGGVGTGKSRTSLAYYEKICGRDFLKNISRVIQKGQFTIHVYKDEKIPKPLDLYIITTARKRDTLEWEGELAIIEFPKSISVKVDSWNNIKKYIDVTNSFFIFDEQRVVGYGAWTKAFLKITERNKWILLSATPGDTWSDYIPVFIANGFYRNKTEFQRDHCVFKRFSKFPIIEKYINTGILLKYRNDILVEMTLERKTIRHNEDIFCDYDKEKYKEVIKTRFNPYTNEPIKQASELCYVLRHIVNEDDDRIVKLLEILEKTQRAIIFYNFDYERDMLLHTFYDYEDYDDIINPESHSNFKVAEWSGHAHEPLPNSGKWVYLVQYTAGAEGWNCTETDTIIFFSQTYSYKTLEQASGRIDRVNTKFKDLYYYHLKSKASIDIGINRALNAKKEFNEKRWCCGSEF